MNLAATVVFFNPQKEDIENLRTYAPYVSVVYAIDNSENENYELIDELRKFPNVKYFPNKKNYGIAGGLNIASKQALNDGYSWLLTLDQDSSFSDEDIKKYIELFEENKTNIN